MKIIMNALKREIVRRNYQNDVSIPKSWTYTHVLSIISV